MGSEDEATWATLQDFRVAVQDTCERPAARSTDTADRRGAFRDPVQRRWLWKRVKDSRLGVRSVGRPIRGGLAKTEHPWSIPVKSPPALSHGAATETYAALRTILANVRKPTLHATTSASRSLSSPTTYVNLRPPHDFAVPRAPGLLAHLASDCKPCGFLA